MLNHWDDRFLDLAEHISAWSKDPSTKVGAVIVRDKKIISVGYNGFAAGVHDHHERLHDREMKYKLMVHAEMNAIVTAKQQLDGCTIYVSPFQPCATCASLIVQSGIKRVVSYKDSNPRWLDSFKVSTGIFEEAGVTLILKEKI